MSGTLSYLSFDEPVRLDPDCLAQLCHEHGEVAADDILSHALEEISIRLNQIERDHRRQDRCGLRLRATGLVAIAHRVGMIGLARVAGDVARLAETGDAAAVGATVARLMRLGERSFTALWDVQNLSL